MSVNLNDIARRVGVSAITVSRALAGSELVAEGTRERILAAAEELKYIPNALARSLLTNRSETLGVIVHELTNPFFAPLVSAIQARAAERGFLVTLGESGRNEAIERRYVDRFQQIRTAAIVVHPASRTTDHLNVARLHGTPVVAIARRWEMGDFVSLDNVAGGRMAARHLLERGHHSIGIIRSRDPENTPVEERASGFAEALSDAGVKIRPSWDIRTDKTSFDDGLVAADRLLALRNRPRGVFAVTDRVAMAIVHRLLERGVRVPEDVAVVGFDDMPFAEYAQVPLTTLRIPVRRMGDVVAEVIFDRLDGLGTSELRQVLMQPELVVRASS